MGSTSIYDRTNCNFPRMNSRAERLVENELLFRQVNERIAELGEHWSGELDVVCECANERCTKVISMRAVEYTRVREHSDRFIVLRGHQVAGIENVVETTQSYVIVEKLQELLRATGAPT
jgi:hypothetical protein